MTIQTLTFSPLELCDQGRYEAAGELAGVSAGEWPKNDSGGILTQAERLLVAGIITSTIGGIQQTENDGREMIAESIRLSPSLGARSWLAWANYWDGDIDGALVEAERLLALILETPARFRLLLLRSTIYWSQGLTDQAFAELLLMESLYDQCGPLAKGKFHHHRALIRRQRNELDDAIMDYDASITFFREVGNARWQGVATNNLATVYLETEQFDRAHECANRARQLFHELGDKTYEAEAMDQAAQIFQAQAQQATDSGIALVGQIGAQIKQIRVVQSQHGNGRLRTAKRNDLPEPILTERRGAMMAPLECASHLIQNPDNAIHLLDLLIWATSARNDPAHETELDEIEEMLYSKTDDGIEHRKAYRGTRLLRVVTSEDS